MREDCSPSRATGVGVVSGHRRCSLGEVRASVAATAALLAQAPEVLWQASGSELGELLARVDELAALAAGLRVAVTAEALGRGEVASSQCATTAAWVAQHAPSLANGSGAGQVAKLVEETARKPVLAPALDAVVAGQLPVAVAQVVLGEFDKLRKRVVPEAHELVLEGLVQIGVAEGARQVRRLRPALLARYGLADELQRDQDRAAQLVALSYGRCSEDGSWEYRFTLDPEGKAVLEAAIGPLSAPWHPDGARDARSAQQRRAQALIEVCRRVTAAAKAAGPYGGYPTDSAATDTAGSADASGDSAVPSAGSRQPAGHGPNSADSAQTAAASPASAPQTVDPKEPDGARVGMAANAPGTESAEADQPGGDPRTTLCGGDRASECPGSDPLGPHPTDGQPPGTPPPESQRPGTPPPGTQRPGTQPPGSQPPDGQPPGSQPLGSQPPKGDPARQPTDGPGNEPLSSGSPGADPPQSGSPGADPPRSGSPGADPPRSGSPGADPPPTRPSSVGSPSTDRGECDAAMMQAALAGLGSGGTKATLMVTMPLGDLQARVGAGTVLGTVEDGALLAPETVRRAACDARVIPVVLGGRGEVLELGRAERLFTPAQARAVLLRDRHCTFPRCDSPAFWCQLHHVVHWADGGPTDWLNAALLCGRHHVVVHRDRLIAITSPTGVRWDTTAGSYDTALNQLTPRSA